MPVRENERVAGSRSLAPEAVEPSAVFWRDLGGTESEAQEAAFQPLGWGIFERRNGEFSSGFDRLV